jgi:hypothetical protein
MMQKYFTIIIMAMFVAILLSISFAVSNCSARDFTFSVAGGLGPLHSSSEPDHEDLMVFDAQTTLIDNLFNSVDRLFVVDFDLEAGVLVDDEVHPKVYTILHGYIPVTKNIDVVLGFGVGQIINSGSVDGLIDDWISGTFRYGVKLFDRLFLGFDHYSMIGDDSGRNLFRIGLTF